MKYSDKLKDPRWQKMRLEILNRDEFSCQRCGDSESTLHVHHLSYEKGKEPWDYVLENFMTLCQSCHDSEYECRSKYEKELLDAIRIKGFAYDDVDRIATSFSKIPMAYPPEVTATIIEFALTYAFQEITNWFWDETHKKIEKRKEDKNG